MTRLLKQTKTFLKDSKKVSLSDKHFTKFVQYLSALSLGEVLPEESKDHALVGNWEGYREFHLSGDVLIIYKVTEGEIILTRMGSHSQLFE
ncbi:MAG: hypothetical protein RLZZ422_122 [Pseudomonadota bacterium]|jgi:mRNA interferase YafQ